MPETQLVISKDIKDNLPTLKEYADSLKITSEEEASKAGIKISQISDLKKKVEDQRVEITRPLNASLRSINAFFKKFSKPLAEIDKQIRNQIVVFGKKSEETFFGVVHLRANKVIKVTDETLVPREYLKVDLQKVKAGIKAGAEIPGVSVIEEKCVSL